MRRMRLISALALIVTGIAGEVLFIFKPWAQCEVDDTPAGCPATDPEIGLMIVSLLLIVAGVVMIFWRRRTPSARE